MPSAALTTRPLAIVAKLADVAATKILIVNKVDLVAKPSLLGLVRTPTSGCRSPPRSWSRRTNGDGVAEVKRWLAAHVPPGPWHYPGGPDFRRADAGAGGRDHPGENLSAAAPGAAVPLDRRDRILEGTARTARCGSSRRSYVERESQRKIVLGKGGQAIRSIGAEARKEIAQLIEKPVHLFLFVKVREGWGDDPERYREMGLEFPRD